MTKDDLENLQRENLKNGVCLDNTELLFKIITDLEKQLKEMGANLKSSNDQVKYFREDLDEAKETIKVLQKKLKEAQSGGAESHFAMCHFRDSYNDLRKEASGMEKECKAQREKAFQLEKDKKHLEAVIRDLRKPSPRIKKLEKELKAQQEKIERLEYDNICLETLANELKKVTNNGSNNLDQRIKELERANAELTRQIETMKRYANFD